MDFPAFVYVRVGGAEKQDRKADYDRLTTLLKQHLPAQVKLHHEINDGADHENSGGISLPKALKTYFSTTPATLSSSFSSLAPEIANFNLEDTTYTFERTVPDLKKAFIDPTPADRKDYIPVGELGVDGGNKDMILKLAQEIADNKYDRFDSLLISYQGKLLFESYYLRGRINLPHYQASATKSYTCLAIGRAIQLGYLTMTDLGFRLLSLGRK